MNIKIERLSVCPLENKGLLKIILIKRLLFSYKGCTRLSNIYFPHENDRIPKLFRPILQNLAAFSTRFEMGKAAKYANFDLV